MSHTTIPTGAVQRLRNEGITALREGDKPRARTLLAQALKINPRDAQSWLWLSGAVDTPVEQRFCLERLLELCPKHPAALEGLAQLDQTPGRPAVGYQPLAAQPEAHPQAPVSAVSWLEPVRLAAEESPDDAPDEAGESHGWLRSLLGLVSSMLF